MLAVLYLVFTNIFKNQIDDFGMYLLLGIIMWNTLSRGTEISLNSLVGRSGLVTQIYFPKEVLAISATITTFLMLCFEFLVFGIFMIIFQFSAPSTIIVLPLILLLEFILILGLSFPLSILNARYKDIQFIWRIVLHAGFFLTPIFYKLEMLPQNLQDIMQFLPTVQIIEMAHQVAIYGELPTTESIQIAIVSTLLVFGVGYLIFKKTQNRIVEDL